MLIFNAKRAAHDEELQAAVHAFRGVPQGRAAGAWDAHAALMDRSRDRYG